MEKIELIQALNYIEKEILALDKLKPSGISYFVKVTFSKVYATAILKILLKLKPDEEDIYYFNVRRRNGYGRLKNSKIVGIGFRKYTKLPEWKLYDVIEFDGATYELWCYYEDSMMIANEYQDALNCYQLQFYDLEILEDFYNCLRCELNAKKQGKQK